MDVGFLFAIDVRARIGGVQWEHYYCIIAIWRCHICAVAVRDEMSLLMYVKKVAFQSKNEGFPFLL